MQKINSQGELAILLDLDGTIVNSMIPLKETFMSISSKMGLTIDEKQRKKIGQDLRKIIGGRSTKFSEFKLIWRIGNTLNLPIWQKSLLLLMTYPKLKQTARSAPPIEGVIESIIHIKKDPKIKLGLISSRNKKDIMQKLFDLALLNYFDVIISRDDVENLKPSTDQIKLASKILEIPLEACIIVGDMPTDIYAAKEAGALAIGVNTGIFPEELRSSHPDLIIESLIDLPKSLRNIAAKTYRRT